MSLQQQAREIHRTYLAIVEGIIPEEGTIGLPIARKEDSIIERCVDGSRGECAITHYRRISTTCLDGCEYSLVQIQLETGRTHQIRVHMKAIGHPLPGDFLYNPNYRHIKRQAHTPIVWNLPILSVAKHCPLLRIYHQISNHCFQRFSDSAALFFLLDPVNIPSYPSFHPEEPA